MLTTPIYSCRLNRTRCSVALQRRIPARHALSSRCLRFRRSRCNERLCSLHSCATIRTMPAEVLALPLLTERLPLPPSPSLDPLLDAAVECISRHGRSEEHTSELQSLMRTSYAVF